MAQRRQGKVGSADLRPVGPWPAGRSGSTNRHRKRPSGSKERGDDTKERRSAALVCKGGDQHARSWRTIPLPWEPRAYNARGALLDRTSPHPGGSCSCSIDDGISLAPHAHEHSQKQRSFSKRKTIRVSTNEPIDLQARHSSDLALSSFCLLQEAQSSDTGALNLLDRGTSPQQEMHMTGLDGNAPLVTKPTQYSLCHQQVHKVACTEFIR